MSVQRSEKCPAQCLSDLVTSIKRVLVPFHVQDQKCWVGIEVVKGQTPFLFSKRAMKALHCVICTVSDTCWLGKLGIKINLHTNPSSLYMLDLAGLCNHPEKFITSGVPTLLADQQTPLPVQPHVDTSHRGLGNSDLDTIRSAQTSGYPRLRGPAQ